MSEHRAVAPPPTDPGWAAVLACVAARAYLGVLVGLLVWTVLPLLGGWHSSMILSDSMAPAIRTGDVVVVQPRTDARPGQVVVADDPDHPDRTRTHRLERVRPDGMLVLRGDANLQSDSSPVARADLQGIARLRVPYVALPAVWMRTGREAAAGGWLLATILAILLAPAGGSRRPTPRAGTARPGGRRRPGRLLPAHRRPDRHTAPGGVGMFGIAVVSTAVMVIGGSEGGGSHAAFTGTTTTNASFSAAAAWCPGPGSYKVDADADDWVDESFPAASQSGATQLSVLSSSGANRRSLVRFPLAALPAGCAVTGARLVLTTANGTAGRTIEAVLARGPWTEGAVTWNSMPTTFGTPATATSVTTGALNITVTDQISHLYSVDRNYGFVIKDAAENQKAEQTFENRETRGGAPTLVVSYG